MVLIIGITIILIGIALLVLPGPGTLVIILGLALLGTEFIWARRLLKRVKESGDHAARGLWSYIRGRK
ncbi:MAG: PGPGW domain-containing protein [Acidobacteria bacterium]|nr:PGPGW domain-containing protein [Acidobacteriota bacterium]